MQAYAPWLVLLFNLFLQDPSGIHPQEAWSRFQSVHSGSWDVIWNSQTDFARFVSGSNIPPDKPLRSDSDFEARAREILAENWELFGIDPAQLILQSVNYSPLSLAGIEDKVGVQFSQSWNGVEVLDSSVVVLFLANGTLTAIDSQFIPNFEPMSTSASISAGEIVNLSRQKLVRDKALQVSNSSDPRLVIYPSKSGSGKIRPRLAWICEVFSATRDTFGTPTKRRYIWSADHRDPELLADVDLIHHAEIRGTLQGFASNGLAPYGGPDSLHPVNIPENLVSLYNIQTRQPIGTSYTDLNGVFSFANQNVAREIRTGMNGRWVAVDFSEQLNEEVAPNTPEIIYFNSRLQEYDTAEVNSYHWVTQFRNFLLAIDPQYHLMDFQVYVNANSAGTCNAYYDGVSINFMGRGSGCPNTAYSTVIAHEEGHWANDRAGSGNGWDGFGEGSADTWALYLCNTLNGNSDDPCMGLDFFGPGTCLRSGENTRRYCGDGRGGCYGEVHDDGEPLMGALWKVRRRLKENQGANAGRDIANALFVAWYRQYEQREIHSIIERQWLTLDDNDGNLSNGTPHCSDIDWGFRQQGFPGFTCWVCPPPPTNPTTVYVNLNANPNCENGTSTYPYNTVGEGAQGVATNGTVQIQAGTYTQILILNRGMILRANGGTVRIRN